MVWQVCYYMPMLCFTFIVGLLGEIESRKKIGMISEFANVNKEQNPGSKTSHN